MAAPDPGGPAGRRSRRCGPAHAALLTAAALGLAATVDGPVCAHLPVGVEPWSPAGVEALRERRARGAAARGRGPRRTAGLGALQGPDALVAGPFGLREPAGTAARAGGRRAAPGWCCSRRWRRTGAGCAWARAAASTTGRCRWSDASVPLVVVLDEGELVDALPAEPHDRRVTAALLPETGVTMLGGAD